MQIIPTTNDGSHQNSTDVNNGSGLIIYRSYWNYITQAWHLDIRNQEGQPILLGQTMVIDRNIVRAYPTVERIVDDLRIVDTEGLGNRTENTLGNSAQLIYLAPGEYDARAPEEPALRPITNVDLDDILQ